VPDLPEATAQHGHDFLLNLRIVQQTQEHLLESLVLLGLLDLVFSFGSIFQRSIMPSFRQPSVQYHDRRQAGGMWRRTRARLLVSEEPPRLRQNSVLVAILCHLVFLVSLF
jgi:hypothetical protein